MSRRQPSAIRSSCSNAIAGKTLFRRRPRPLKLTAAGEQLFPVVRDGFSAFADGLTSGAVWRDRRTAAHHRDQRVCGTMARAPAAELARACIRASSSISSVPMRFSILQRARPTLRSAMHAGRRPGGHCIELARDTFRVVASPKLVGDQEVTQPARTGELSPHRDRVAFQLTGTRRIGNAGRR